MSGRIICGVDGSERGYEAVAVARDLAARFDLPLMLAHVVDEPGGFPFGDAQVMEEERRQRQAHGVRVLQDMVTTLDLSPEVGLRVESGDPAPMLRTLAIEETASLLVVASRGRGRIRSALFGSVSADLVDGLPCPMLVVTPGAASRYRLAQEARDPAVVCGIDHAAPLEELVPLAGAMAEALGGRLVVIHADLPPAPGAGFAGVPMTYTPSTHEHEDAARRMLAHAEKLAPDVQVETRAELGELATTMAALAGDQAVQLLAVAQDSAWQRLAAGAGCPVLVVPTVGGRSGVSTAQTTAER